ncbi:uncharacterized protein LOC142979067 [Anticarsia gemmatalis]|uniref:uncharacterized protein LOC142979067 n=1 Tax=Anticarsia gemmatalis TaxID=129554 RepID=UPI003F774252
MLIRTVRRGDTWTGCAGGLGARGRACGREVSRAGSWSRVLAARRHAAVARRRGRAAGDHSYALGYVPPLRYIVSTTTLHHTPPHATTRHHAPPHATELLHATPRDVPPLAVNINP